MREIFNVSNDAIIQPVLTDNLFTPIPSNKFAHIVENYSKSGSFYVNFKYDVAPIDSQIITSEVTMMNVMNDSPSFS